MDSGLRKTIENNMKMLNSTIEFLCNNEKVSSDMIESSFHAIELLTSECKELFYSTIEEN